jgi:hypothetical protein
VWALRELAHVESEVDRVFFRRLPLDDHLVGAEGVHSALCREDQAIVSVRQVGQLKKHVLQRIRLLHGLGYHLEGEELALLWKLVDALCERLVDELVDATYAPVERLLDEQLAVEDEAVKNHEARHQGGDDSIEDQLAVQDGALVERLKRGIGGERQVETWAGEHCERPMAQGVPGT